MCYRHSWSKVIRRIIIIIPVMCIAYRCIFRMAKVTRLCMTLLTEKTLQLLTSCWAARESISSWRTLKDSTSFIGLQCAEIPSEFAGNTDTAENNRTYFILDDRSMMIFTYMIISRSFLMLVFKTNGRQNMLSFVRTLLHQYLVPAALPTLILCKYDKHRI